MAQLTQQDKAEMIVKAGITKSDIEALKASDMNYKEIATHFSEKIGVRVSSRLVNGIFEYFGVSPRTREESYAIRTKKVTESGSLKRDRLKIDDMFTPEQMEAIGKEYADGGSLASLSRKYSTTDYNIRCVLERMNINLRNDSAQSVREKGLKILSSLPPETYTKPFEEHEDWSLVDLCDYARSLFPDEYLSDKTLMFFFTEVLGLSSTQERRNKCRSRKSRTESNSSYMVKINSIRGVEASSFGSVDNLTKEYCSHTVGTLKMLTERLNREQDIFEFTQRRLEKLIWDNEFFVPRQSHSELIFVEEVVRVLGLSEDDYIHHARPFENDNTEIDLLIPSLGVGFEFNGDYWHSDAVIQFNYGHSAREHHQQKRDRAEKELGIKLLFVWENDFEKDTEGIIEVIRRRDWGHPVLNTLEKEELRLFASPRALKRDLRAAGIPFEEIKGDVLRVNGSLVRAASVGNNTRNRDATRKYREMGENLLTIYPWMDMSKVLAFLSYAGGSSSVRLNARSCEVELSEELSEEVKTFIKRFHILNLPQINKGDFLCSVALREKSGNLLGVMVFCREKENKRGKNKDKNKNKPKTVAELKRLVFRHDVSVRGGASRMLKHGVEWLISHGFTELFTYSDNDISAGGVYESLGFTLERSSSPGRKFYHPRTKQSFAEKSLYMVGADRLLAKHPHYRPVGIGDHLPSNREIVLSYGFKEYRDSGYRTWVMPLLSSHL